MKNKKSNIIAVIMIILGIIICIIAYFTQGIESFRYDGDNKFIRNFTFINENNSKHLQVSKNSKLNNFKNIELNLNNSTVKFITSNKDEYSIDIKYNNEDEVTFKVENEILKINDNNLIFKNSDQNIVKIHVPKDLEIDEFNSNMKFGDLYFENINIKNLNSTSEAGDFELKNTNIEKGNLNTDMGDIDAENVIFTDSIFNTGMGDIEIYGKLLGNCSLTTEFGDIELELNQNEKDTEIINKNSIDYDKDAMNIISVNLDMGDFEIYFN